MRGIACGAHMALRSAHGIVDCLLCLATPLVKTLGHDRTEKLVYYASNDIPEYWIVNLQAHTLECYHNPVDDEYRERRTRKLETQPRRDLMMRWGWTLRMSFWPGRRRSKGRNV